MAASSGRRAGSRCLNPDVRAAPLHPRREARSAFPPPSGSAWRGLFLRRGHCRPARDGPGPEAAATRSCLPGAGACAPRCWVWPAHACAGISLRPRAACSVCVLPPVFGAPPAAPRGDGWLRMGPRTSGAWRCGCSPLTGCWGPRHGLFEGVPGAKATWGFSFSFFPFRILQWDTSFRCQVDSLVLRHAHHLGGDPSVSSAPGTVGGH